MHDFYSKEVLIDIQDFHLSTLKISVMSRNFKFFCLNFMKFPFFSLLKSPKNKSSGFCKKKQLKEIATEYVELKYFIKQLVSKYEENKCIKEIINNHRRPAGDKHEKYFSFGN